jgi:hypothetical protein
LNHRQVGELRYESELTAETLRTSSLA